jgi:hypothetical protein
VAAVCHTVTMALPTGAPSTLVTRPHRTISPEEVSLPICAPRGSWGAFSR